MSGAQAEAFVQLARQKQPRIGRDRGTAELDAKLRVEREANRAQIPCHPLDDALRTSEAPQAPAFLAGAERLWLGRFSSQNENAGPKNELIYAADAIALPAECSPHLALDLVGVTLVVDHRRRDLCRRELQKCEPDAVEVLILHEIPKHLPHLQTGA